jgi:hypothetical protein
MSRLVSLAAGLLLALATPTNAQSTLPKDLPGFYQLLEARATDAKDTKPTAYTLTGHEAEFGRLEGQRVEVAGTVAPPLGDVRSGKMAGAADGAQRIRVSSVKKIEGRCSAAKK